MYKELLQKGFNVIPIYGITKQGMCQCGDPECPSPGKHPKIPWREFQEKRVTEQRCRLWFRDEDTNIGIITGKISNLVVVDEDEQEATNPLNLPQTLTVSTSQGRRHFYYKYPEGIEEIKTGPLKNFPKVDIKGDGGFVVCPPSRHISGTQYKFVNESQPMVEFPTRVLAVSQKPTLVEDVDEGERNVTLTKLAGSLLGRGLPKERVLSLVQSHNILHCHPPLSEKEVEGIVLGIAKSEEAKQEEDLISQFRERKKPGPLSEKAYYGLTGEILRAVDPYTEASPVAILLGFLVGFGNKIGRNVFMRAQQDYHYTNLYGIVVGDSATSRKGVAWSLVRDLLLLPIQTSERSFRIDLSENHVWHPRDGGIASGEGIIDLVRDDIVRYDMKERRKVIDEGSGIEDKRVLLYEAEFASVLRKASLPTSIIWPVLRTLWDRGSAENTAKNSPIKTTNAHISFLGNITEQELNLVFPQHELVSGTANRILWAWVERSKSLPSGKPIPFHIMNSLREKIENSVVFGQKGGELQRSQEAEKLWIDFYESNFKNPPQGFLSSILDRADAQVLRLSILYAILDQSLVIEKQHLEAALAAWDYFKASAEYLFGETTGFPLDNKILNALELQGGQASRTEISKLLSNNYQARELDVAYQRLRDAGLIVEVSVKSSLTGRSRKVFRLKS